MAEETPGAAQASAKAQVNQLEALLEEYLVKKAPFTLPDGVKEFIVTISPYVVIISAIVLLPAILVLLGIGTVLAPIGLLAGGVGYSVGMLSGVVSIIAFVIEVMAVPGLFKRTKAAWRLVFYATIVSLIGSLIAFNIIGGLIGAIIGWYFLFQIKEKYVA